MIEAKALGRSITEGAQERPRGCLMLFTGLRTVQQTTRGIEESKDRQSPYFCANVLVIKEFVLSRLSILRISESEQGVTKASTKVMIRL